MIVCILKFVPNRGAARQLSGFSSRSNSGNLTLRGEQARLTQSVKPGLLAGKERHKWHAGLFNGEQLGTCWLGEAIHTAPCAPTAVGPSGYFCT